MSCHADWAVGSGGQRQCEDNGIDWVDFHLYGDIMMGSISCAILISDGDLPAR
jgi:hypothetical protein